MNIRVKFVLLLGSLTLLATLAVAVWFLGRTQEREVALVLTDISAERGEMLDQLLELNGQSLRNFSTDYSLWTEMTAFLRTGDKHWAEVNIDASLANFGAHAAWVLQLDGSVHYSVNGLADETLRRPPFMSPEFLEKMRELKTLHFFHDSSAGLLEVRTAPIQPSEDTARASPPLGWLIVARLWDDAHVRELAKPLQSTPSWQSMAASRAGDHPRVQLHRSLLDWKGQTVRTLYLGYQPAALAALLEGNIRETRVLYATGIAMVCLTGIVVWYWVITPLQRLSRALELSRPEELKGMARGKNEFGHLAELVEQSFAKGKELEREIRERTRAEEAMRDTETRLRHSLELRSRLARDLHDGIIQSIYAAGLGLESVRSLLGSDPAMAEQRLASCRKALNDTLAEVRSFIAWLEPAHSTLSPLSFAQALNSMVETIGAFQPVKFAVSVDQAICRCLSPEQELNALKVVRESISNALRHGDPQTISLSLKAHGDTEALLEISDDGTGFDAAQSTNKGRGLLNLHTRAREMDGTLQLDSAPTKGTCIRLRFKPARLPHL